MATAGAWYRYHGSSSHKQHVKALSQFVEWLADLQEKLSLQTARARWGLSDASITADDYASN